MAATAAPHIGDSVIIERIDFQRLLDALRARGYQTIGPTVRDGAIVYDEVTTMTDLPVGWGDEQAGGRYRLRRRNDEALFGYTVGPQGWNRFLHPPVLRLWQAQRTAGQQFVIVPEERDPPRYAFFGVRACELYAIQIQDRVFLHGAYVDPDYQVRRENAFVVAVNCSQAGGTCFCVSMASGPQVGDGFDLALTEVVEGERHYFVVAVGTEKGKAVLDDVPHRAASTAEVETATRIVAETAAHMGRTLETAGLKELLYRNLEHPHWDEVASRCLTCGNCTLVCPTCFCTTVEDVTDLTGQQAERWRKADSCFTTEFSRIYSGSVRASAKARYRQWMTHKLASWVDQFGTFGCVGCGRCITWCPVGIDITEEARASRTGEPANAKAREGATHGDA
ncbi:MAG: 4Fe-4S dicluster domain-containing protein [Caldilineaceae bacterium]|nr:4Fe-4S dicluster domain-containing protein [Caldilineaceae bacterium]